MPGQHIIPWMTALSTMEVDDGIPVLMLALLNMFDAVLRVCCDDGAIASNASVKHSAKMERWLHRQGDRIHAPGDPQLVSAR